MNAICLPIKQCEILVTYMLVMLIGQMIIITD